MLNALLYFYSKDSEWWLEFAILNLPPLNFFHTILSSLLYSETSIKRPLLTWCMVVFPCLAPGARFPALGKFTPHSVWSIAIFASIVIGSAVIDSS